MKTIVLNCWRKIFAKKILLSTVYHNHSNARPDLLVIILVYILYKY